MLASSQNDRFRNLLLSWPEKAVRILYESYYDSLLIISQRFTHDLNASEDIVQETFTHVWQHHKSLGQQRSQSIQYYLVKVVKNKSITVYKQRMRLESNQARYANQKNQSLIDFPTEADIISLETNVCFRLIVDTFPRRERECLMLRFDSELSVEEIANELSISKKAVERSITSAKKRLRRYKWALT